MRYVITYEGASAPIRCQTGRGALTIARSFASQGRENIQISIPDGETYSPEEFEPLVRDGSIK